MAPEAVPLTAVLRSGPLTPGQRVTLVVGLALELAASGTGTADLHPAHVVVDRDGRPHVVEGAATGPGESAGPAELLRLGRCLGPLDDAVGRRLADLATRRPEPTWQQLTTDLMAVAVPEPLNVPVRS